MIKAMNQIEDSQEQRISIDLNSELSKNLTVHKNVKQEFILTTTDKIKLVLIERKESMLSGREWWMPLGLLISFVTTLLTADFKDALYLPKDVWHALFVWLTLGSVIWLIVKLNKLRKHWGRNNLDKIIEQIKLSDE